MNGETLVERVSDDTDTELTRLASEKALLAATGARLEPDVVLELLADTERRLGTVYSDWAGQAPTASETLSGAAERAAENASRLTAEQDSRPDVDGLVTTTEFEDIVAAVGGGLVGSSLVLDGLFLQAINFFVNEADEGRADLVRGVRTANDTRQADGAALLDTLCETDEDWTRAETTARDVIETSYESYVERLDAMGIDPRPVC